MLKSTPLGRVGRAQCPRSQTLVHQFASCPLAVHSLHLAGLPECPLASLSCSTVHYYSVHPTAYRTDSTRDPSRLPVCLAHTLADSPLLIFHHIDEWVCQLDAFRQLRCRSASIGHMKPAKRQSLAHVNSCLHRERRRSALLFARNVPGRPYRRLQIAELLGPSLTFFSFQACLIGSGYEKPIFSLASR